MSSSHCCIENASGIMDQVNEKFKNRQGDVQSNQYEKSSLEPLYLNCKEFCREYEEYVKNTESYIVNHSRIEDDEY